MVWWLGLAVVLVLGAAVLLLVGHGEGMAPVYDDRPDAVVPDGPLTGEALRSVRFSQGFRGYRADEVDALLARLAEQLDQDRDAQERP